MRALFRLAACMGALSACSSPPAPKCPGSAPAVALHESYCQNGEAARCYFLQKPVDGF
jgi:hypothetical protein